MGGANMSYSHTAPTNVTPDVNYALANSFLGPYLGSTLYNTWTSGTTAGAPQYGGPLYAPMTPSQAATVGSGTNFYNSIAAGNSINNPMLNSYISAATLPIMQQYQQAMQANEGAFTQAGQQVQSSSPYAYAQALANRGAMQAIGSTAAGIAYPAYQLAAQQQYQAPLNALTISSVPQQIAEQGVQAGLSNYQQQLNYLNSLFGNATRFAAPIIGATSTSYGGGASGGYGGGGTPSNVS